MSSGCGKLVKEVEREAFENQRRALEDFKSHLFCYNRGAEHKL